MCNDREQGWDLILGIKIHLKRPSSSTWKTIAQTGEVFRDTKMGTHHETPEIPTN